MHDTPLTPKVSQAVWGVLHVQPEVHLAYNAPLTPKVSDMNLRNEMVRRYGE